MRSFEERKEEIFYRSDKRIKQRKKAVRRVILTCVPLVLCVTALSGYLALGGFGRNDLAAPESAFDPHYSLQDSVEANGAVPEAPEAPGGVVHYAVISAQLQAETWEKTYTDAEILWQMEALLPASETAADSANVPNGAQETDTITQGDGQKYGTDDKLTLTLTYEDGSIVEYTLTGNQLVGPDGVRELTGEQLVWLESLQEETT